LSSLPTHSFHRHPSPRTFLPSPTPRPFSNSGGSDGELAGTVGLSFLDGLAVESEIKFAEHEQRKACRHLGELAAAIRACMGGGSGGAKRGAALVALPEPAQVARIAAAKAGVPEAAPRNATKEASIGQRVGMPPVGSALSCTPGSRRSCGALHLGGRVAT